MPLAAKPVVARRTATPGDAGLKTGKTVGDMSIFDQFINAAQPASEGKSLFDQFVNLAGGAEPIPPSTPCCVVPSPGTVFWGMENIPLRAARTHFVIVGTAGSGKTLSIRLFLQSIAERVRPPNTERLILFDPKRDMLSVLAGIGFKEKDIIILNPFDKRSHAWDIAQDIKNPAQAHYLGDLLIPEEPQSSAPYFWRAARQLTTAAVTAMIQTRPGNWTLLDLLCVLALKERLVRLIGKDTFAQYLAENFIKDERHIDATLSHIATNVGQLSLVAALWQHSSRKISLLSSFNSGVVVLADHPIAHHRVAPINALILQILSDQALSGPETEDQKAWFVLDEFRWMEKIPCVGQLLNQGRSKGVSVVLGLQDLEGLKVVYKQDGANEILSGCNNKSFLRISNPATSKWAQENFEQKEQTEYNRARTTNDKPGNNSTTDSARIETRPLFLAAVFRDLRYPELGYLEGIHDIPITGRVSRTCESFSTVLNMLRPIDPNFINEETRDAEDQRFIPWTKQDEQAFLGTQDFSPDNPLAGLKPRTKPKNP